MSARGGNSADELQAALGIVEEHGTGGVRLEDRGLLRINIDNDLQTCNLASRVGEIVRTGASRMRVRHEAICVAVSGKSEQQLFEFLERCPTARAVGVQEYEQRRSVCAAQP